MTSRLPVLVLLAAGACGGGGDDDGAALDGGADDDGADAGGPAACDDRAALSPPWLDDLLDDTVARLSGAAPIRPGVSLIDRATPGRRGEARDHLAGALAGLGLEVLLDDYGSGTNVYAELPPTDGAAAAWLVLGAHLDSVATSPGANDNATGVALVLAAARYLGELPCRRRGVIVAFFDEEEIGLVGSGNFAELLTAADLTIDSVHTIDQMGWDMDGDRAIELELPAAGLLARYRAAADAAGLDVPIAPTDTPSSDHQSFRAAGFAAVGVTEEYASGDTTPHYHLASDTHETVDLAYLASTASLIHAVIGGFAIGDGAAASAREDDGARPAGALGRLAAARPHRRAVGPAPGWVVGGRRRTP